MAGDEGVGLKNGGGGVGRKNSGGGEGENEGTRNDKLYVRCFVDPSVIQTTALTYFHCNHYCMDCPRYIQGRISLLYEDGKRSGLIKLPEIDLKQWYRTFSVTPGSILQCFCFSNTPFERGTLFPRLLLSELHTADAN